MIFYCAEYDLFEFHVVQFKRGFYEIFKVKGWKEYCYWKSPGKGTKPICTTMLTEFVYIGDL